MIHIQPAHYLLPTLLLLSVFLLTFTKSVSSQTNLETKMKQQLEKLNQLTGLKIIRLEELMENSPRHLICYSVLTNLDLASAREEAKKYEPSMSSNESASKKFQRMVFSSFGNCLKLLKNASEKKLNEYISQKPRENKKAWEKLTKKIFPLNYSIYLSDGDDLTKEELKSKHVYEILGSLMKVTKI